MFFFQIVYLFWFVNSVLRSLIFSEWSKIWVSGNTHWLSNLKEKRRWIEKNREIDFAWKEDKIRIEIETEEI
jgi:hypothetical protein